MTTKNKARITALFFTLGSLLFALCSCGLPQELAPENLLSIFSPDSFPEEIVEPDFIDFEINRIHYSQLHADEQSVYRCIYNSIFSHPKKIFIPMVSEEMLSNAFSALKNDNPHLLCLENTYSYYSVGNKLCFSPEYGADADSCGTRSRQTVLSAKAIVENMPDFDDDFLKELYLHDGLTADTEYFTGEHCETAYGALIKHRAQCSGYALAFKLLLDIAGVESFTVDGSARNSEGLTELHKWNCVKVNGSWYFTDVTWDDPISEDSRSDRSRHNYFNVTEEEIRRNHFDFTLPKGIEANADEENFYVRRGLYCNRESYRSILKELVKEIKRLPAHLELRLSSSSLMYEAVDELFNRGGFSKLFREASKQWDSHSVSYSADEEGSIIQIYIDLDKEG